MARVFGCAPDEGVAPEDGGYGETYAGSTILGRPHVVVKFQDALGLMANDYEDTDDGHGKLLGELWRQLREQYGDIKLRPLFRGVQPNRLAQLIKNAPRKQEATGARPNVFSYFQIVGPAKTNWDDIATRVSDPSAKEKYKVEAAYVERPGPDPGPVLFAEPRYPAQRYLHIKPRPAGTGTSWIPGGIDAEAAWAIAGGCGQYAADAHVHYVDVERGWKLDHRDLPVTSLVTWPVPGGPYGVNYVPAAAHGTATLGILCMRDGNAEGGVGGAPHARGWVVSCVETPPVGDSVDPPENTAAAILAAIDHLLGLRPEAPWPLGDVIVIERQIRIVDPADGQPKWVPVELLDSNWQMIRLAADYGITVIEAGGNGAGALGGSPPRLDLDAAAWSGLPDSGAILVSAANVTSWRAPMAGAYAPAGQRIDCFGWGNYVTTAWTDAGATTDMYTSFPPNVFGYTSAATAIVAAAAICLQGIARAGTQARPLSPSQMRRALRNPLLNTAPETGEPPIGLMPNLAALAPACASGSLHV